MWSRRTLRPALRLAGSAWGVLTQRRNDAKKNLGGIREAEAEHIGAGVRIFYDGRDYDNRSMGGSDLPFWVSLAQETGGPVLELACGTGRVSIPIAQAGISVTGIDISESMLRRARAKTAGSDLPVRWLQADMREFDLGEKFPLVICPAAAFSHLESDDDVASCLARVRKHLELGGMFAVDVFNPDFSILVRNPSVRHPHMGHFRGAAGATESTDYDRAAQVSHTTIYVSEPEGGESTISLILRMYFPREFDALLESHGFEIEAKYGDHDRRPFDSNSRRQLVVANLP